MFFYTLARIGASFIIFVINLACTYDMHLCIHMCVRAVARAAAVKETLILVIESYAHSAAAYTLANSCLGHSKHISSLPSGCPGKYVLKLK